MIYPPDFDKRAIEEARRATADIAECDKAEVRVIVHGMAPMVQFVFGDLKARGRPALGVSMIAESRKNPLAPGRLIVGDELRRHVRDTVERYLKLNGIEMTRKAMVQDACV